MKVGDLVKHCTLGMGIVARPQGLNQCRWFVHWADGVLDEYEVEDLHLFDLEVIS